MIRVFDAFSGIRGFRSAFERVGEKIINEIITVLVDDGIKFEVCYLTV